MLSPNKELISALQQRVRQLEIGHKADFGCLSSGSQDIDQLLPAGGFRRGSLIEWLGSDGSGAGTLALMAAREACRDGGGLVIVDCKGVFYPPAAANLGIDLTNTIVVCPRNRRDHYWALHQALSCPGVAAVLCWPEKLDGKTFRQLQLAAENGGSLGLLVRSESVIGSPSWSDVQLLVQALPTGKTNRRLRVKVVRCRSGQTGKSVDLEINDETGTIQTASAVHLAAELARSAIAPRAPRA